MTVQTRLRCDIFREGNASLLGDVIYAEMAQFSIFCVPTYVPISNQKLAKTSLRLQNASSRLQLPGTSGAMVYEVQMSRGASIMDEHIKILESPHQAFHDKATPYISLVIREVSVPYRLACAALVLRIPKRAGTVQRKSVGVRMSQDDTARHTCRRVRGTLCLPSTRGEQSELFGGNDERKRQTVI